MHFICCVGTIYSKIKRFNYDNRCDTMLNSRLRELRTVKDIQKLDEPPQNRNNAIYNDTCSIQIRNIIIDLVTITNLKKKRKNMI